MVVVPAEDDTSLVLELRRTLARLELALAQIADGFVITDADGAIIWCNGGFETLLGRSKLFILGTDLIRLLPELMPAEKRLDLAQSIYSQTSGGMLQVVRSREPLQVFEMEWRPVLADGESRLPFIFRFHDISDRLSLEELRAQSEELRLQQLDLAAQVVTCPVTGLPNRRALLKAIDGALRDDLQALGTLAVIFCDLNHFKQVNDTYGHQIGDRLLIEIARRMQEALRPQDLVARIGGDEFVLLCTHLHSAQEALVIGQRVIEVVSRPWTPADTPLSLELFPEISVGIALCTGEVCSAEQLLQNADLAMYEAKSSRSAQPVVFDGAIDARHARNQLVCAYLQQALARQDVGLHLQPLVRLETGVAVGYEALCRPLDAAGVSIEPREFIAAAEAAGLIAPLGQLLLDRCCSAVRELDLPARGQRLSINFSSQQLAQANLVEMLEASIQRFDLPASAICLEFTETALLTRGNDVIQQLHRLRSSGFKLLIDDFGIGYSSLNGLLDLPVDGIKIDHTFTATMLDDPRRMLMLRSVVELVKQLRLELVVEGVETCQQRDVLMEMGCDLAQGYLFGAPAPLSAILISASQPPRLSC
ncbi:MAG: putative bifunctional diguanylate cyclase/phosphodiesterase [Vulcanococcus sp.]